MTADNAHDLPDSAGARVTLDELARQQGVRPTENVAELACYDAFESDEEVDEFIAFTYAMRRADVA